MPEIERQSEITSAWLLAVSRSFSIAVAQVVVAEYILEPELKLVPGSIDYCNQVVNWRGEFIPVMDLSVLFGEEALDSSSIAVIAYQEYQGQSLQYAALKLSRGVEQIEVSDESMCDIPEDFPEIMRPLIDSIFSHDDQVVAVINLADLCNEGYSDYILAMRRYQIEKVESAA